jgi:hypothetical protein
MNKGPYTYTDTYNILTAVCLYILGRKNSIAVFRRYTRPIATIISRYTDPMVAMWCGCLWAAAYGNIYVARFLAGSIVNHLPAIDHIFLPGALLATYGVLLGGKAYLAHRWIPVRHYHWQRTHWLTSLVISAPYFATIASFVLSAAIAGC